MRGKRAAPDAATLAAAGLDCLQREDFPGAVRHLTAAREHATLNVHALPVRAGWLAAEAAARLEAGAFGADDAARVTAALAELAARDDAPARVLAARLRGALGRHHGTQRNVITARHELEKALHLLDGNDDPLLRARLESLLGAMVAAGGDVEGGLGHFQAARARLDTWALQAHLRDRARVTMNAAIALGTIGRASEAADTMALALPLFEALAAQGRRDALPELARARRNLGFLLGRNGRHATAVDALQAACADYERALRRRVTAGERTLWTTSLASTRNSLGFSLATIGRLDDAEHVLHRAARTFARLVRVDAAKRDELARVWVNLGHVAMHRRDYAAAARLYRQGSAALEALITAGRRDCEYDALNAQLGEAHAALGRGRVAWAAARIEPALAGLAETTQAGQLQNALPWFEAWQRHLQAALHAAAGGADVRAALAALERALAQPPLRPASNGPEPALALRDATAALATARAAAPVDAAWSSLLRGYREYLFGWSTTLLSESDPEWLRRHADAVGATVRALGDAAADDSDGADALAGWFLATRGLRAQRTVLAEPTDDPLLGELHERLLQLQELESEMLGEPGAVTAPSVQDDGRAIRWRVLRTSALNTRRVLEDRGVLPRVLRLQPAQAQAALPPHNALVMLARVDRDHVRAVALTADGARVHAATLDDELAAFPCTSLHALARAGMRAAASGQPVRLAPGGTAEDDRYDDGDAYALQLFTRLWQQAMQPLLDPLWAGGVERVALVPSDDLHLAPWNTLADRHLPATARLHVYASAAAWWRGVRTPPREVAAGPRWTLLCDTALRRDQPPLPWLDAERRLSLALWRDAMSEPPRDDAAGANTSDALLAMGHGLAPDGNAARGGLSFGGRVLRPGDLAALQGCRRALLSACLLGRTDDVQGEGLGFLAASMDRQLDFATGWLTEVPDFAACLFSLAAQWCLREAPPGGDWSDVLRALRLAIAAGQWPAGFGAWLAGAGDDGVPGLVAVAAAPPLSLRRVLPWAVTLGR